MTMITPSYLGETIEYSSLHACRSTLEDPTTGTVSLFTGATLLEFASGQIGTIDGAVELSGNARIADAGTLATNSALTGLNTVAGELALSGGASVTTTGGLSITGNGVVWLDAPFNNSGGGSSLTVGGTLTNTSTNNNGLYIGNGNIGVGDTVTATGLVNTGVIQIQGAGTIQSTLDITTGPAGFGTLGVETGTVSLFTGATLLEFASGQIGTIDGAVELNGNARIADAGTLATNSALTGLNTVAGELALSGGASVTTTGGLSITGNGVVWLDAPFNNGGGGGSLAVGGTLTNTSTNNNGLYIGNGNIGVGDTVTATGLVNTGVIQIVGAGTIQSTLDITTGPAGFGTVGVETGTVVLTNDALLEFASGQIGTINGGIALNGVNARIADAGTLATNSALTGLNTVTGSLELSAGATVTTTGGLSDTGNAVVWLDAPFNNGGGGSSLTVGGTLTVSSTNNNGLYIGNGNIGAGDTVTATGLVNSGVIQIVGAGTIVAALNINGSATNSDSVNIDASGIVQMGAGDIYTQAVGATNVNAGGKLAGTVDVTGGAVNIAAGGTLAGTANVTGGSLDGTGTVAGTVNDSSGGTVFAGPSIGTPGTLTVIGTYNQSGTGDLEANIGSGGTSSGVVADTGGFVNLTGGTLSVSGTPAVGSVLTVMTFGGGGLVGQFAAVQDGTAIGNGSNVNLGDGTTLEVFYNNDGGNIQIERVNNSGLATGYNWTDATGNWSTAADWSGGQVPNPTANVVIGNTTTGNVTLNSSSGDTTVNSLSILASNALTISGVTLTSATGGGGISVAAGATLSLSNGEIDGSTLSGAGLLQTTASTSVLAGDTISAGTSFIGQNSTQTDLLGAIDNAGTLEQIGGNGQNGVFLIGDAATLTGGGTVTLSTNPTNGGNAIVDGNGATLTNTNNTIQGSGVIGNGNLILVNGGVIDATQQGGATTLTLNGGGITNTGTMEAAAGAVLVINNSPVVDNAGGTIKDLAATSTVEFVNATIEGGTLNDTARGTLETIGSAVLDGSTHGALTITSSSTYTATGGSTTYLLGSIVNDGLIQENGGNGQNTVLDDITTPVTLTGGGTVTLDTTATNGGSAIIEGNAETLTNTNNTIQGTGIIGNGNLILINQHIIDATPEGGSTTLTLNGGNITNTDLLEATAGGVLVIQGNTVDNAGANITVSGATSTVELSSATVQGGTLNNSGGGTLETVNSAVLDGSTQGALTLSTGSTYTANDATTTYLLGSIVNDGLIQMNGGNGQNEVVDIITPVTLSGGGTLTIDTVATNGGSAFLEGNGETLTNTNNTIQGTGIIGNGNLVLINGGVVDATPEGGSKTLTLNGSVVTNNKLLEATAGGTLSIATNITNTAATITSTGSLSAVTVSNGATITGGTLNTLNGGVMASTGSATLQSVTLSAGSTYTSDNGVTTTLLGTIDNLGTIEQIGGNGQNGFILIGNAVTLTGGGTVTLDTISNGGSVYVEGNGQTLTNTNNTIQGTGVIGNGNVLLINEGLVDATPESGTSTLTLNGGGVTNTSTMEASAGGVLVISTTVNNAGGNITTSDATSTVDIAGATVEGGTLNNTTAGGTFETTAGSTLDGTTHGALTISTGSSVTATNNTTTSLLGTIDNEGSLEQIGGNGQNGFLNIAGATTLTGGGTVTLDTISNGGSVFVQGNAQTLTNTNNTIQGTGIIGNGSLALINEGLLDATPEGGTSTLTLNGGLVTNTSTMEASAGGVLLINTTVNNSSGNITTADATSTVEIDGATVEGGTVNNTVAGGTFETVAGSTLDGVTHGALTISTGSSVTATNNTTTNLLGTINNKGTLEQIGGNGQNGFLDIAGAVTLTGGGTLTLDDIAANGANAFIQGNGEVLTNTNNTIQGTGIIGNGSLGLINGGVIDATPEGGSSTLTLNGSGTFVSTGTLEATGGATLALDLGAITVSGLVSVAASSALDLTGELTVNGTLANFGAVSGGPATEVAFGSGNDRLILGPAATFGGTVAGGGINSTIELAAGTGAGTLTGLGTNFTNFGTVIVDPGATWTVDAAVSLLATTTFIGNGALSTLALTGAGTFSLANVSNFGTIDLAAGNNTVTVTDKTLSGGAVTINDGASGNDNVSAASDTSASKGKSLTYNTGSGTDTFTGGFENDTVSVSAAAVAGDTLTGGSGTNTLVLTSAGNLNLAGVSKFSTIDLAAGNSTVTVTDALLSGGSLTINDGASGNNTISAAGDTSASKSKALTYNAGTGTDSFTGGFENDAVHVSAAAVGGDTLTGGSGTNTLTLTSAGTANLGGVSKFGTINLAAGNSTVTVTNTTLSGGSVSINDGASGNNSISAAGDTSASTGKTLTYYAGTGTDSFTGGFEIDGVHVSAAAVGGDTLTGGSGANVLTLTSAGTVNLGGVSKFPTIDLAAGNNTVTVTDKTLSGGSVAIRAGASGNNTVSAAGDTSASAGKVLTYFAGPGTDSFTGGFEIDGVHVSAAAVGGDTLTGGSGANVLTMTSAGTVNLGGVSKFATIDLAAGNNTVTVTDKTLSGGSAAIYDGASGNNTVSATGDTSASTHKTLTYYAGTGTDSFAGEFEIDSVHVSAAAVGGDTLTGGSGANILTLTTAGTANLGGVSKFETITLDAGNSTVTVTDKTLSSGSVALHDGPSGNNTVSAAGDTSASAGKVLTYYAGTGTDSFTGGFEIDGVHVSAAAVGGDTLTGGSGANVLTMTSAGTINLGGVSNFGLVNLAAGNTTGTVTDKTLSGGSVTISDGASGNNTVSAAGDTSASAGKTLTYDAGRGIDTFTGGFEIDGVHVSAAAVSGDTLTGGSGANVLTLTTAGAANLGGVSKFGTIGLAAGNSTVTVTDTTLSGGSVAIHDGASGKNTISAAGDTSASAGKTLTYFAGTGTDSFTGGFEIDGVHVSAAAVGGDTLTGGSGANVLTLTSAGTVNLGGVSKFGTISLTAGNNTVTVTDKTLSGGSVAIHDGASGNNTVSAAGDTSASTGKTLTYYAGTGTDSFTGGFENDGVHVSAAAVGGDTLTGGSGSNTLTLTSAGTANLGGVSDFGTINLAAGNSTVTVTDKTLSGGAVTINDGTSGNNTISAAGDTSASTGKSLTYHAGTGTNGFTGGFENDTIYAGTGSGTYTAGSGADSFVFIKSNLPSQTLNNFQVSTDDILVYGTHSAGGFDLGSTDNALNPSTPTAIDVSIFVTNASGDFTSSSQRFAYDTTNGNLFYSATGSNTSESLVASLTGEPGFTASNLLFEH